MRLEKCNPLLKQEGWRGSAGVVKPAEAFRLT